MTIALFERVRKWARMRGVDGSSDQVQYQRFLQEAVEIHDAMINNDPVEFRDAIGDTIVTLINLAKTHDEDAEDCLEEAFSVIEFRKGLTKNGSFIRYGKLDVVGKLICDEKQGSPKSEYFAPDAELNKRNFKN